MRSNAGVEAREPGGSRLPSRSWATSRLRQGTVLVASLIVAGCTARASGTTRLPMPEAAVAERATLATIERHTRELAGDQYEGRFPGTNGEERTVAYLERELRRLGLDPGNPDGSYVQRFAVLAQRSSALATLTTPDASVQLAVPAEAMFIVGEERPRTSLESAELVFVGYGISAPEYRWDDYAGVDVRGKAVLVLRGEPGLRLPADSSRYDLARFRGEQLTYHGTVERKWEVARDHGAAAVILVSPALGGYRNRVARSRGEFITLGNERWPAVVAFFGTPLRARVFAAAGREFSADSAAAGEDGFRAIPLGSTLSLTIDTEWRRIPTRNVVARLPGSDPQLRGEHVV